MLYMGVNYISVTRHFNDYPMLCTIKCYGSTKIIKVSYVQAARAGQEEKLMRNCIVKIYDFKAMYSP